MGISTLYVLISTICTLNYALMKEISHFMGNTLFYAFIIVFIFCTHTYRAFVMNFFAIFIFCTHTINFTPL